MTVAVASTPFVFPARLSAAFLVAVIIHMGLVGIIIWAPKSDFNLPEPLSGFEMIELPSPATLPEITPIEETIPQEEAVQQPEQIVRPEPIPEPASVTEEVTPSELAPKIIPKPQKIIKPVARITPAVQRKPKPPERPIPKAAQVKPAPKPIRKTEKTKHQSVASPPVTYIPPNANVSYLRNPKPFYPRVARKRGLEGTVLLSVSVNAKGLVTKLTIKKTSGHSSLDKAALRTVQNWKFQPAKRGNRTISAVVEVPIRFKLNGR